MGKTKGAYKQEFANGSRVRVVDRAALERFQREWQWHHPLEAAQLDYAGHIAEVTLDGYYHGGDELYTLRGVPGIWHEQCLEPVTGD